MNRRKRQWKKKIAENGNRNSTQLWMHRAIYVGCIGLTGLKVPIKAKGDRERERKRKKEKEKRGWAKNSF